MPYYVLPLFYKSKISKPNGSVSLFEKKWFQFEKKIVLHKEIGPSKPPPAFYPTNETGETVRTLWSQTNLDPLRFPLLKLPFSRFPSRMLPGIYKKNWIRFLNWFFRLKPLKKDYLGINSRPNPPMSIAVGFKYSVITFVNIAKTTLLLLGSQDQTKFYL